MKKALFLSALFWLLLLQACGQATDKAYAFMLQGLYRNTVPHLKPAELQIKLNAKGERPLLLDTRQPEEYKVSHLAGAELVDYNSFDVKQLQGVPKSKPIILYCSVGYRSERVGEQLKAAGFSNVQNLYGGLFEWVNQGYPVYNSKGKTEKVHAYSKTWGVWLRKGEKVYGSE